MKVTDPYAGLMPRSALVHGPSKTGKSQLMQSAPKPLLFVDVEGNTRFLPNQAHRIDWDLVSPLPALDVLEDQRTWVRYRVNEFRQMGALYDMLNSTAHPFRSVVIDSTTELQQQYVDQIAGSRQMELQGWGELYRGMKALLKSFKLLTEHPTHPLLFVGMTAMSKETGKTGKMTPWMQGQTQAITPYLLDILGFYTPVTDPVTGQMVRRLFLESSPSWDAGSRVSGLPKFVDDPRIADLFADGVRGENDTEENN